MSAGAERPEVSRVRTRDRVLARANEDRWSGDAVPTGVWIENQDRARVAPFCGRSQRLKELT